MAEQSQQLALQIFDELKLTGRSITESPVDISFAKNNLLIDLSELGLIARRSLNAALYIASTMHPDEKGTYLVELDYFKWLINFDKSNNLSHLKKSLRDAQKSAMQVQVIGETSDKDSWASVPLLGAAGIANGKVAFKVPDDVIKHVKNPESYTMLSLRISSALTSQYALTLYEKLNSMLFRGGTEWMTVENAREYAGASGVKTLEKYGDFKRYVLTPSIEQINELTDISVTLETKCTEGTRRITHIKFKVTRNENGALNLYRGVRFDLKEVYDILVTEFGLNQDNLNDIMANRKTYTDARILDAVHFTRDRMQKTTVKYPALYLLEAIKKGHKLSEAELKSKPKARTKDFDQPKAAPRKNPTAADKAAAEYLEGLDAQALADLLSLVAQEHSGNSMMTKDIKSKGLSSKRVEVAVRQYIISHGLV
ncbi:replication initiation protein [Methylobacillus sp. Pita2]|uniref:replication initiation protein n=1 Tax=Methylobacillus sp. Pita2 TaxID=3383245 RepID=UPI0038B618AB